MVVGLPALAAIALIAVSVSLLRPRAAGPAAPQEAPRPAARVAAAAPAPPIPAQAARDATPEQEAAGVVRLIERTRELEATLASVQSRYDDLANWVLTHVRGRFPLKSRYVANLRFPPLGDDGLLNADLADFLEVGAAERELVNDALSYGRESLFAIESQLMTSTQSAPDRVSLHIPPFPDDGAAVRSDLMLALETTLGRGRFDRFLDVAAEEMDRQYDYFGAASRTIVFQLADSVDPNDPPYLVIRDGRIIPKGQGRRDVQMAETSVRQLPPDYLRYLAWLPDFVAAYAPVP